MEITEQQSAPAFAAKCHPVQRSNMLLQHTSHAKHPCANIMGKEDSLGMDDPPNSYQPDYELMIDQPAISIAVNWLLCLPEFATNGCTHMRSSMPRVFSTSYH